MCERTPNDRKGGHVAVRRADGRLILRDTAQTADEDMAFFTDETVHRYFNTNNLWWNLEALKAKLDENHGVLDLPLIRNVKTVDPKDPSSPEVVQIESAMGAAIELFDDARVLTVARDRFVPVKKTNELLLLRSDVYEIGDDGVLRAQVERIPRIDLGPAYAFVGEFDRRIPHPVGLRRTNSLAITGDWSLGPGVQIVGDVVLGDEGGAVAAGEVLQGR